MPESTDVRQASDGLTSGFGAGTNGPLLISVDMSDKPAKADQKQPRQALLRRAGQKDKANKQAEQQEEQLEAQGMPPDQAQAQVQPQLDKQLEQIRASVGDQRKKAEQPATDPRLQDLRDDLKKTSGVKKVSRAARQQGRHGGGAQPHADDRRRPTARRPTSSTRLRDDTIPKATQGQGHVRSTSAGRPPATSTSRRRSATS